MPHAEAPSSHHIFSRLTCGKLADLWNPVWRCAIGGCNLNRDMLRILKGAGEWDNFESVEGDEEKEPLNILPRVWGELVKSRPAE